MDFSTVCPNCKQFQEFSASKFDEHQCQKCNNSIFPQASDAFKDHFELNQCPHCGAAHIYKQKDFNRTFGISLLVIGIILSFFTYGISLLIVTALDWWLYHKVGWVGCCYLCHSQFRSSEKINSLEAFDLELYDYYRNLKT